MRSIQCHFRLIVCIHSTCHIESITNRKSSMRMLNRIFYNVLSSFHEYCTFYHGRKLLCNLISKISKWRCKTVLSRFSTASDLFECRQMSFLSPIQNQFPLKTEMSVGTQKYQSIRIVPTESFMAWLKLYTKPSRYYS